MKAAHRLRGGREKLVAKVHITSGVSSAIADILASVLAVYDVLGLNYAPIVNGSLAQFNFGNVKATINLKEASAGLKLRQAALEALDDAYVVDGLYKKWRTALKNMTMQQVIDKHKNLAGLCKSLFVYRGGEQEGNVLKLAAATRLRTELTAADASKDEFAAAMKEAFGNVRVRTNNDHGRTVHFITLKAKMEAVKKHLLIHGWKAGKFTGVNEYPFVKGKLKIALDWVGDTGKIVVYTPPVGG